MDGNGRLYRLKLVDSHGCSYVILESREKLLEVVTWLEDGLAESSCRIHGFDDDADRRPIMAWVRRESIEGALLTRVS